MTALDAPTDVVAQVGGWDDNDTVFLNRELSWLAFNARVLQLASDGDVPLLEQVRFLSIFSRNLDEFFQVRVSGLFDQAAAGVTVRTPDGLLPGEQLAMIRDVVRLLIAEQERQLVNSIVSQLTDESIELVEWRDLADVEQRLLTEHFRARIFPILTPLAVDPGHPFPYVSDLSLNLAVIVCDPVDQRELFARVKVPNTLPRWTQVGDDHRQHISTNFSPGWRSSNITRFVSRATRISPTPSMKPTTFCRRSSSSSGAAGSGVRLASRSIPA
jgi:polyphosphate kinase